MTIASVILAGMAIVFGGLGIIEWAFNQTAHSRQEKGLKLVLGSVVGLGFWSSSYSLVLMTFGPGSLILIGKDITLCVIGIALLRKFHVRHRSEERIDTVTESRPTFLLTRLFVIAVFLSFLILIVRILTTPEGGMDAQAIWNLRARFLRHSGHDLGWVFSSFIPWTHADYPLLLPGIIAQAWIILGGGDSPIIPSLVAIGFASFSVALLTLALSTLRTTATGLTAGLVLLGSPSFLATTAHQLADVPVGTYVLLASVLVAMGVEGRADRKAQFLIVAGIAASMAAWMKNEGLLYGLAFALALVFVQTAKVDRISDRLSTVGWFILGATPILLLLLYFKLRYAPANELLGFENAISKIMDFSRIRIVLYGFCEEFFKVTNWNIFLLGSPILLLLFAKRSPSSASARVIGIAIGIVLFGFAAIYLLTPYPLQWHIRTSIARLVMQCWPAIIFSTFLALREVGAYGPVLSHQKND